MSRYSERVDVRWHLKSGKEAADSLQHLLTELRRRNNPRRQEMIRLSELYGTDMSVWGGTADTFAPDTVTLSFNQLKNVIDTHLAKIVRNRPMPSFLTDGGSYEKQRKAKSLTKFMAGVFDQTDFYKTASGAVLDSLICGVGAVHFYPQGGKLVAERVMPVELLVDKFEARYGAPRGLYMRRSVDRMHLAALFPEAESDILTVAIPASEFDVRDDSDMLPVDEAWHIPSTPESKDGKHIIVCGDIVLHEEPWEYECFPFAFFRHEEVQTGFWCESLAKQLAPGQKQYEFVTRRWADAIKMLTHVHLAVERSSAVESRKLDNQQATLWEYSGTMPQWLAAPPVPADLYNAQQLLPDTMLAVTGTSAMASQAKKPAGITAGVALETLDDIESERLTISHQAYERFIVEATKQFVRCARELAKTDEQYRVKVKDGRGVQFLEWGDVDMPDDEYTIHVDPVSLLSRRPAAKLQQLRDLLDAGIIDGNKFRRLSEMPDISADTDIETSDEEVIEFNISRILDHGETVVAEPYDNLEKVKARGLKAYNLYRTKGVSEERLELLRQYIESAVELMGQQTPPEPPPGAMVPPGMPGPEAIAPPPAGPGEPALTPPAGPLPGM